MNPSQCLGMNSPNKKLMNVDFSALTANELWDIFESKASNGGSLAYAVLSRARKLGCPCSISLDKLKEGRLKQKKDWLEWTSKLCNAAWAQRYSYEVASSRSTYHKRITACWSASAPFFLYAKCDEFKLSNNTVARIASLAVHPESAELLDQVLCCASDARRDIVSILWLKINESFVCCKSWVPLFEFSFSQEVDRINPSVCENDDLCPSLLAATWARILSHLRKIFSSPSSKCDRYVVWNHCVCDSAFQIPVTERVIVMWIWLLWSSRTLPAVLKETLTLTPETSVPQLEINKTKEIRERLKLIADLRTERIITKTEYLRKRQRILELL
jgi:hypothetical protein